MESIVSRAEIRERAHAAVASGQNVHIANPYPAGTAAHIHFERDYWDCVHALEQQEALV